MVYLKIPISKENGISKILVVDDDQGFREVMQSTLSMEGLEVTVANSGYEAIDLLKASKFDLVIADYRMQNGDGVSLSHYCSKHGIQCIVFTGSLPEVVRPYLPAGTPVVEKVDCFEPGGLFGALKRHLVA